MVSSVNIEASSLPANEAEAVTKSDTTKLTGMARALYVGGAGNASLLMGDGTSILFSGLSAGTILPVRFRRVNSTDTTATLMVALY